MTKLLSTEEMTITLSRIFEMALTEKTVRSSWKWNHDRIIKLRMKRLHSISLVLKKEEMEIRAFVHWSEPYYENDIQVRIYFDNDVVNDLCCSCDHGIIRSACKQSVTTYNSFKRYSVDDIVSVNDFLLKYYRKDRFSESLFDTYNESFQKNGFCFISDHDSVTRETVAFFC